MVEQKFIDAKCPICGQLYLLNLDEEKREAKLCTHCGASGRSQALALFLSRTVFGNDLPLSKQRADFSKRVIGLSDGEIYATVLRKKCNYTNTFYHKTPFLNISDPAAEYHDSADVLISSEVFEHVLGLPSVAFAGAHKALKYGGSLILSVPYVNKGQYKEHYPGAINYTSFQDANGNWVAEIEFENGMKIVDQNSIFHGGPGKTLEMRLFNRARLEEELENAGFINIEFHTENIPEKGYYWGPPSRIITAQKKIC